VICKHLERVLELVLVIFFRLSSNVESEEEYFSI